MTDETRLYNTVAPLRNVSALLALVLRLQNRNPSLPGMATFYGPSGYGKTAAAVFATNKFRACHVEVQSLWRAKSLLAAIVHELGLRPARTSIEMFEQAAAELARNDRVLLLDEADHLAKDSMIEVVRGLHQASGAPVILIGEELLPQKLQKWERVHGRMLDWVALEPASLADVQQLAPIYAPGIEIDEDLTAALLKASRQSIRRVSTNLAAIDEFARGRGLGRVGLSVWGKQGFFTGEAPAARRDLDAGDRAMAATELRRKARA